MDPPRKKILVLAGEYPPFPYGVATLARQQCAALAEEFEVAVVTPCVRPDAPRGSDGIEAEGFRVVRFAAIRKPVVRLGPLFARSLGACRSFGPDLIFCPQYRGMGPVAMALSRLFGVPRIGYFHGTEMLTEIGKRARMAVLRRYLRGSAANLCNSSYSQSLARELSPPGAPDPVVVHPGLDAALFASGADGDERLRLRGQAGLDEKSLALLTVGRIDRRKALDVILDALKLLRERESALAERLDWWVVGDGPDWPVLAKRAASELGASPVAGKFGEPLPKRLPGLRVAHWGLQPSARVAALMRAADAFALASRETPLSVESFGMVYAEAGAAGLPVVGARVGGVADAIEDGGSGLLVEPDNPQALAEALARLLSDPGERRRLGRRGRERAETLFDWGTVGPLLRRACRQALEEGHGPSR